MRRTPSAGRRRDDSVPRACDKPLHPTSANFCVACDACRERQSETMARPDKLDVGTSVMGRREYLKWGRLRIFAIGPGSSLLASKLDARCIRNRGKKRLQGGPNTISAAVRTCAFAHSASEFHPEMTLLPISAQSPMFKAERHDVRRRFN